MKIVKIFETWKQTGEKSHEHRGGRVKVSYDSDKDVFKFLFRDADKKWKKFNKIENEKLIEEYKRFNEAILGEVYTESALYQGVVRNIYDREFSICDQEFGLYLRMIEMREIWEPSLK